MKVIKIIFVVLIILALTAMTVIALLDGPKVDLENSWDPPEYKEEGTIQSGMSAYTMFMAALENYYDAEHLVFLRSLDFHAAASVLVVATQQTIELTKFNSDKVFHQVTKQGTLLGASFEGHRFYYDGNDAFDFTEASSTRFPELGVEDWDGLAYAPYVSEKFTTAEKLDDLRLFSSYTINESTLSQNHDDNVYKLNNKYYISITLDCMEISVGGIQAAVEESIMDALGDAAQAGSFRWEADTVIYLEITEVGGEYFITARNMQETYSAIQQGIRVGVNQTISGTYSYNASDADITEAEKMNKA